MLYVANALGRPVGREVAEMRPYIAVIGNSDRGPHDPVPPATLEAAREVGREIARQGCVLVCGGLTGVMEAAAKGAKQEGGLTVGLLPGLDRQDANRYIDVPIATGLGYVRNHLIIRTSDAVIMVGGGIGTLNELTLAYQEKPTVVLEGTGGWADRVRTFAYEGMYLDASRTGCIRYTDRPAEAVALAVEATPRRKVGMAGRHPS